MKHRTDSRVETALCGNLTNKKTKCQLGPDHRIFPSAMESTLKRIPAITSIFSISTRFTTEASRPCLQHKQALSFATRMSGESFLFIEVVETTNKNGGPQDLTTPKVGNRCGNICKTRRFNSQSPGAMEEDEPLAVRVLLLPAVEEPPSPTRFHSSQRFSLRQCSKTVFFHFDRLQKNQFLKDGLDSGPPSLPWTLPSLGRLLLDRPPLTPRLDRPLVDPSSAGPPLPDRPKFRSLSLSRAPSFDLLFSLGGVRSMVGKKLLCSCTHSVATCNSL